MQAYAPELNKRCRQHLKSTNKSYRIDETYIKVKGKDRYLYRAVDSTGHTIDFLLTAKRDAESAKRFFRQVFSAEGNPMARVLNVDKNPAYPAAVRALKAEGTRAPRSAAPMPLLKQCRRAGPQDGEEACVAGQRIRFVSECVADVAGYRSSQHDSEGKSEMAEQGRCARPSLFHCRTIRHRGLVWLARPQRL